MAQFYGNEQIQHTLHQMLLRDRAPHGFLFYGETGLGKKTLATVSYTHLTLPTNSLV